MATKLTPAFEIWEMIAKPIPFGQLCEIVLGKNNSAIFGTCDRWDFGQARDFGQVVKGALGGSLTESHLSTDRAPRTTSAAQRGNPGGIHGDTRPAEFRA